MVKKGGLVKNGQTLGTTILASEASFAIWSSLNPSLFTLAKFADQPEDMPSIRQGMLASLAIMGITALGIKVAFGKKGTLPAIAHVGTGLGLFTIYGFKIGWERLLSN